MSPKSIARPLDIYIRVSDVRGRAGESFISPKDQEERCRAALKAKGLEAGEIITDLDVSGGKMERPGLDEVIGRIRGEQSGGVVVARIDRFGRTVVGALQVMQEIDEAGGVVITAEGDFDTSTAVGELVLNFMLSLAQFELRRIRENWQGAKRRAVERGIHITRHVPPGYTRGEARRLGAHADFAEPIREAFRLAAVGEPYARIAAHLNEHQVPSGDKAVVWQANRIKRLLANRVYLGEARSGNGHVNAEAHEALTDEATWLLAQRTPRLAVTTGSETLLAGLCRCASCSFSMKGQHRTKPTQTSVYRCPTTTVHGRCDWPVAVTMDKLDAYVLDSFLARTDSLQLKQVPKDNDATVMLAERAAEVDRRYRAALTNVALREQLGDADHDEMLVALKQARDEARAALPRPQARESAEAAVADIRSLVEELQEREDKDSLRELLAAEIQAVFVRPAASRAHNLPIEDRVRIVWRDEAPLELPRRGERFEPRAYAW